MLKVTGTGGGLTRSTTITLNVAGYLFSIAPASVNTIPTNGIASYNLGITYTHRFWRQRGFQPRAAGSRRNAQFYPFVGQRLK